MVAHLNYTDTKRNKMWTVIGPNHKLIIIIIIIRDLYSAIMSLGGYRGAGGTGR